MASAPNGLSPLPQPSVPEPQHPVHPARQLHILRRHQAGHALWRQRAQAVRLPVGSSASSTTVHVLAYLNPPSINPRPDNERDRMGRVA